MLIPYTEDENKKMIKDAGFKHCGIFIFSEKLVSQDSFLNKQFIDEYYTCELTIHPHFPRFRIIFHEGLYSLYVFLSFYHKCYQACVYGYPEGM